MFHFLRTSHCIHDCFISERNSYILEYSPIQKATKFHPNWWKDLPLTYQKDNGDVFNTGNTMKTCTGYVELYKKSYILPLWSEFKIAINNNSDYTWQFADLKSEAVSHSREQFAGFADNYIHIKFCSPWYIKSKECVEWLYHQPTYNTLRENKFVIAPGVFNFKYQIATNLQVLFDASSPRMIHLNVNQPMGMLTPLTEKKIDMRYHVIHDSEMENMRTNKHPVMFFLNNYKKIVGLNDKKESSGCPFHRSK